MKNQTLDAPIRDSFFDFLEKGEKILWQGETDLKQTSYSPSIEVMILVFFLNIVISLIQKIINIGKNKKTEYAITSKRILFRLAHWKKNKIHDIPFSEIKNLLIVRDEKNRIATIFLVVKNPTQINFDTFEILDKRKSEKRHQPTLENIKDIDKVTQLIRQGIQQNN
jgi:hypothetical protein